MASKAVDAALAAWEWAEGGAAESCLPWCDGLKLFGPPADTALERKRPCPSKVSEWPHKQLHCLVTGGMLPLSQVMVLCFSLQPVEVDN